MFRLLPAVGVLLFVVAGLAQGQQKEGLELLILANGADDAEALKDVRAFIDDPVNEAALDKCQKEGVPPPGPRALDGKTAKKYHLDLAKNPGQEAARAAAKKEIFMAAKDLTEASDQNAEQAALKELEKGIQRLKGTFPDKSIKSIVTYRWVPLGPHALRNLNLDSTAAKDPKRDAAWKAAQAQRGKATTLPAAGSPDSNRKLLEGALFYSRECKNQNLSAEERAKIGVEYFVLARDAEFDPLDPQQEKQIPSIGREHILKVAVEKSPNGPFVAVQLNPEGTKLLAALTGKNVPLNLRKNADGSLFIDEDNVLRCIAFIVDGKVVSAPTLNSQIKVGRFIISGHFTPKDAESLADALRPKN